MSNDILQCQTKRQRREDYTVSFTDDQWARLEGAFPTGVCDWSKPGIGQREGISWPTFEFGPGGTPLGSAPRSAPVSASALGDAAVLSGGVRRGAPDQLPATGVASTAALVLGASGLMLAAGLRRVLRRT